jgi:hypothetical protein
MAISVECSACGQTYRLKDEMAGRKIRCKACQTPIEVPVAEVEEEWGETSWPATGSGRGGASRKTKAVPKKSGNSKSVLIVVGAVAGLVLLVALVWGLLKFLPGGNTQLADGTPAPAGSSWVKFTLPDGSASAMFPGEVKSNALPNGAVSHMASVNGNGFALSDKSPMEVAEDYLERNAEATSVPTSSLNPATLALETINGNRCLRKTVMSNGDLSQVMVTFVHNRRMYLAVITKGTQSPLSPSDVDEFLKSVTFH